MFNIRPEYVIKGCQWVTCLCILVASLSNVLWPLYCSVPLLAHCYKDNKIPPKWKYQSMFNDLHVLVSTVIFAIYAGLYNIRDIWAALTFLLCSTILCMFFILGVCAHNKNTNLSYDHKIKYQQNIRSVLVSYMSAIICILLCILSTSDDIKLSDTDLIACLLVTMTAYTWVKDSMFIRKKQPIYSTLLDRLKCTFQVIAFVRLCIYILYYKELLLSDITVSIIIYLIVDIASYWHKNKKTG